MQTNYVQRAARALAALSVLASALPAWSSGPSAQDFAANPVLIAAADAPLVVINLAVGQSQLGPAHGGVQPSSYVPSETYRGYFDPDKCYDYDTGATSASSQHSFSPRPSPAPTGSGGSSSSGAAPPHFFPRGSSNNRRCIGLFSGNFMNWATMTALDLLRHSLTGGARVLDERGDGARTILARAQRKPITGLVSTNPFPPRSVNNSVALSINSLTPFSGTSIELRNEGMGTNTVAFFDGQSGAPLSYKGLTQFHVNVRVCQNVLYLEDNCATYGNGTHSWYKPEGLLQKYGQKTRFALSSYTARPGNGPTMLRTAAKYLTYRRPSARGGWEVNPNREINLYGQTTCDPDRNNAASSNTDSCVAGVNSGIINYINNLGLGGDGYPPLDSLPELFNQGLRYLRGEALAPAATTDDLFRAANSPGDPLANACQANFSLTIGDQFHPFNAASPGSAINVPGLAATVSPLVKLAYDATVNDLRSDLPGSQSLKNFFIDTGESRPAAPTAEQNPLWLAAKYGGFRDFNQNGLPDLDSEWDVDADGKPDNYSVVGQQGDLLQGLENSFGDIDALVGTGSAAGVVSNTVLSGSVVVQALFKPAVTDNLGNSVRWGGLLHALFVDDFGNIREDSDGDGLLSNADAVITYTVDPSTKQVQALRSSTSDGGQTFSAFNNSFGLSALANIEELKGLWNARDRLADLRNDSGQLRLQRSYSAPITNSQAGRYIFTALDLNRDGLVAPVSSLAGDAQIDFTAANFPAPGTASSPALQHNFRLLGLQSSDGNIAEDIVNFVRGEEVPGMRSRKVDVDGDGVEEDWRLGDIVSSSPLVVGPPILTQRYDLIYNDDTYKSFYQKYRNRRQVVYVGANDGMVHAFNAGFYDAASKTFARQLNGETAHPLGAELWAYVPYNLLPHLRWSTAPDYQHVFYIDGDPQTFDVNIFADDADHPGGWGTILVIGMRLGGGDFPLDPDSDPDGDVSDDLTLRSAYVVLDVTNPESPPKLIAEISHEKMGYTLSRPTVIKSRKPVANGNFSGIASGGDQWYLVMGSGPYGADTAGKADALDRAVSQQKAKVFVFDLQNKHLLSFGTEQYLQVPDVDNGFIGDFLAVDWDRDFVDDVVYFGSVTNTDLSNPTGDFWRLPLRTGNNLVAGLTAADFSRTVERAGGSLGLPVSGRAYAYKYRGKHWVAFGTGRFYVSQDAASQKQMGFFGFKEPLDSSGALAWRPVELNSGDMIDVTNIQPQFIVNTEGDPWDGKIFSGASSSVTLSNGVSVDNYPDFRAELHKDSSDGWYYDFVSVPGEPAVRQIGAVVGEGPVIAFSEYMPSVDPCNPLGRSNISQLYIGTGHAAPFFLLNKKVVRQFGNEQVQERWIQGGEAIIGMVKELAKAPQGDAVAQSHTGEILSPVRFDEILFRSGAVSWREIPVDWK